MIWIPGADPCNYEMAGKTWNEAIGGKSLMPLEENPKENGLSTNGYTNNNVVNFGLIVDVAEEHFG
jgi:hypothetical protein